MRFTTSGISLTTGDIILVIAVTIIYIWYNLDDFIDHDDDDHDGNSPATITPILSRYAIPPLRHQIQAMEGIQPVKILRDPISGSVGTNCASHYT